jgi:hypothetical protein
MQSLLVAGATQDLCSYIPPAAKRNKNRVYPLLNLHKSLQDALFRPTTSPMRQLTFKMDRVDINTIRRQQLTAYWTGRMVQLKRETVAPRARINNAELVLVTQHFYGTKRYLYTRAESIES